MEQELQTKSGSAPEHISRKKREKNEGVICEVDNKKVNAMKFADMSFEEVARTRIKAWFANAHS